MKTFHGLSVATGASSKGTSTRGWEHQGLGAPGKEMNTHSVWSVWPGGSHVCSWASRLWWKEPSIKDSGPLCLSHASWLYGHGKGLTASSVPVS